MLPDYMTYISIHKWLEMTKCNFVFQPPRINQLLIVSPWYVGWDIFHCIGGRKKNILMTSNDPVSLQELFSPWHRNDPDSVWLWAGLEIFNVLFGPFLEQWQASGWKIGTWLSLQLKVHKSWYASNFITYYRWVSLCYGREASTAVPWHSIHLW